MAFNGSGSFNRNNGTNTGSTVWADDKSGGVKITTSRHDTHDQDIADGLSNCITKDGQTTITANIPLNDNNLTEVNTVSSTSGTDLTVSALGSADVVVTTNGSANWTIDNNLVFAGVTSDTAAVRAGTADGSDNKVLWLSAGGGTDISTGTRGGTIALTGNENADAGKVYVGCGDASGAFVRLYTPGTQAVQIYTNATLRWSVDSDGTLTSQGAFNIDMGTGEFVENAGSVAAAGTTQGTATAITAQHTYVTGADGTAGVILPSGANIGATYQINNAGALAMTLYPHSGAVINGNGTNVGVTVEAKETAIITKVLTNNWNGGVTVDF